MRAPIARWLTLAVLATALAAPPGEISAQSPVHYYPYPCPVSGLGTDYSLLDREAPGPMWRPSDGWWYVGGEQYDAIGLQLRRDDRFGVFGDVPVPFFHSFAYFRPSTGEWHIQSAYFADGPPPPERVVQWGMAGDIPVPGDYDGDFSVDFAVWRPTTGRWHVYSESLGRSVTPPEGVAWGTYGDCPVPGRLTGDPKVGPMHYDFNVWRPTTGVWYYGKRPDGSGGAARQFGAYGDIPFSVDLTGDGLGDFLVWRPSNGAWYSDSFVLQFGQRGDVPVPSGKQTPTLRVYRPSTRQFWSCLNPTAMGCQLVYPFTAPPELLGAVPLPGQPW